MTDEELLALTQNEIPGKILTAESWFLKEWGSTNSKDAPLTKPHVQEESHFQ
jgi:hypothetical protein